MLQGLPPDRKLEDISGWLPELYNAWIDTYVNPNEYNEDEKKTIEDEANCFLQFEDIAGAFIENDPVAFNNRRIAEEKLENKPVGAWLIRKSSIVDDDDLDLLKIKSTSGKPTSDEHLLNGFEGIV